MSSQIYCIIRKQWVTALPEELVRQRLIKYMIHTLGFPVGLISLEKSLKQIPHLEMLDIAIPERRADLICFGKEIHPQHSLYPLLLVECKAVPLTQAVIDQVVGYNHFLKAFFVSIANQDAIKTGCYDPAIKGYRFVEGLPSYSDLLKATGTVK